MVARIRSGKSLKGAINYNEHKVKEGKADLIMAKGYSKDIGQLKFNDKLNRLQKLADLNTRASTHCLHVSLNFDVTENLSASTLQQIASVYMEKIGFGNQPFLVYQHHDAAHQHVHIISTNIQKDGKRISMHNLGRVQSEKGRKEIEISFGLEKAGDRQQKQLQPLKPINLQKAVYGKMETKRAISNIVTSVVSQYKYDSLPELNAILKQYNVIADRGGEDTRMFEKKGLQYCLLDENGNKIGIPIKASSIYGKPILSLLESKYGANKQVRQAYKEILKTTIDKVLADHPDKQNFISDLSSQGIDVVCRTNEQGFLYGITYVDHNSKSVFNGSELGKQYSAATIQQRLQSQPEHPEKKRSSPVGGQPAAFKSTHSEIISQRPTDNADLLQAITGSTDPYNYLPYELKKKRKRKKRKLGLS